MIRLALPKGRNLDSALAAFRAAGIGLDGLDGSGRSLRTRLPEEGIEVLSLKDWDLPALRHPRHRRLRHRRQRRAGGGGRRPAGAGAAASRGGPVCPSSGAKPRCPRRGLRYDWRRNIRTRRGGWWPGRAWGAEIVELSGSIELAPVLRLAELALDIVQTGRTLAENHLVEIETVAEVAACLVVNRASYQRHRALLNDWIGRLEAAGVVS